MKTYCPTASRSPLFAAVCLIVCLGAASSVQAQDFSVNGQLRSILQHADLNSDSVLQQANRLVPGITSVTTNQWSNEVEITLAHQGFHWTSSAQVVRRDGASRGHGWINEAYYAWGSDQWQFSIGKRITGWDVGYGFRPNDVVQQEKRRSLVSTTLIGVPQISAEYFTERDSLSIHWVNPQSQGDAQSLADVNSSSQESALAARLYHRGESTDWYGFARIGRDSGVSIGTAFSTVASDALELHGSLRWQAKTIAARSNPSSNAVLQVQTPWRLTRLGQRASALIGATYTTESQHSFIAEYWWDGRALSSSEWDSWRRRQQTLSAAAISYPSTARFAIGANMAWQADAFSSNENLHRHNFFLRWSWQKDAWQYAADALLTPSDGGRVTSINAQYQGNQWRVEMGVRFYGGPSDAVIAVLPYKSQIYLTSVWSF